MDLTEDDEIAAILAATTPYDALALELRFMALGLDVPDAPPKPPGRPRKLSFRQQVETALNWTETFNAQARYGRSSQRPELRPVLKQIGRLQAKNALPWQIARLSKKADLIGRFSSTEILPPDDLLPDIDKTVADKLGLTERMVRRIRSDPRMRPFMGTPPWTVRAFEREGFEQAELGRLSCALLTPERLAKGDIDYRNGNLVALSVTDRLALTQPQLETATDFERRCYEGGLGSKVLTHRGPPREYIDELGSRAKTHNAKWPMSPLPLLYRNILLEKLLAFDRRDGVRFIDYNRAIVRRIGGHGLRFLRAIFSDGIPLEEVALRVGRTEEEIAALIARLLDGIVHL